MTKLESGGILLTFSVRWDDLPPRNKNCVRNEREVGVHHSTSGQHTPPFNA